MSLSWIQKKKKTKTTNKKRKRKRNKIKNKSIFKRRKSFYHFVILLEKNDNNCERSIRSKESKGVLGKIREILFSVVVVEARWRVGRVGG